MGGWLVGWLGDMESGWLLDWFLGTFACWLVCWLVVVTSVGRLVE